MVVNKHLRHLRSTPTSRPRAYCGSNGCVVVSAREERNSECIVVVVVVACMLEWRGGGDIGEEGGTADLIMLPVVHLSTTYVKTGASVHQRISCIIKTRSYPQGLRLHFEAVK